MNKQVIKGQYYDKSMKDDDITFDSIIKTKIYTVNHKPVAIPQDITIIRDQIKVNLDKLLDVIINNKTNAVLYILKYINKELQEEYGGNCIVLEPKIISDYYHLSKSAVSKAIKVLVDNHVIARFIDYDLTPTDVKGISKYAYFVNVAYMFFGNNEDAKRDFYDPKFQLTKKSINAMEK